MSIAFDSASGALSVLGASSLSFLHTCTGADRILFVAVGCQSDNITGVTYGGAPMTLIKKQTDALASPNTVYLFYLIAPVTGAHNIVISRNGTGYIWGASSSYTGASQTGQPDSFNGDDLSSEATSQSLSTTTIADKSWVVGCQGLQRLASSFTGCTKRTDASGNSLALFDSNGEKTPAGSVGFIVGFTSGSNAMVMASFSPADGTPPPPPPPPPSEEGVNVVELTNGFYIEGGQTERWRMTITGTTPLIEEVPISQEGYDVFLIAGQSNTYAGEEDTGDNNPHTTLDSTDADIVQIGRWDNQNNQIILAEEPLDHAGYLGVRPPSDWVGWALAFAKMYKAQGYLAEGRKILLVPTGEGGTGLQDGAWVKGGSRYNDAIARTSIALSAGDGSNVLRGILWHQGEDDCDDTSESSAYQAKLLTMIDDMRDDLGYPNVPFVAGGMVPSWVAETTPRQAVQAALADIVNERLYTGYATPSSPTTLVHSSIGTDNHFSASSMRGSSQDFDNAATLGLAGRYWTAFLFALENN